MSANVCRVEVMNFGSKKMLPSLQHGRQRIDGSQLQGVRCLFQLSSCRISHAQPPVFAGDETHIFTFYFILQGCNRHQDHDIRLDFNLYLPFTSHYRRVSDPMKFGSSKRTLARFLQWMMGYRDIFAQVKVDESSSKLDKHLKTIHENLWNQSHNLVRGCFFFWWIWNAFWWI